MARMEATTNTRDTTDHTESHIASPSTPVDAHGRVA